MNKIKTYTITTGATSKEALATFHFDFKKGVWTFQNHAAGMQVDLDQSEAENLLSSLVSRFSDQQLKIVVCGWCPGVLHKQERGTSHGICPHCAQLALRAFKLETAA